MENEHIRLIPATPALAEALADYYRRNREFLKPTDPPREDSFYTGETQRKLLAGEAQARQEGRSCRFFITPVDEPGKVIGFIALSNIVWGAFRSCFLGYALDKDYLRRGYMTGAVAMAADYAFHCLGLHRMEANVMPRNRASLGVLEKNGFQNEGLAKAYLNINGVWEDHVHMVKLNDDLSPAGVPFTARPYEPGDYEFVYELKKTCYHDYVAAIWGWEEKAQREMFGHYLEKAAPNLFILLVDGVPVGFLDGEEAEGRYELGNLCLLPQCRGKSLGTRVLEGLLERTPGGRVGLQVFKTNPARRLYERLGFRVIGETDHHYKMEVRKEK